MSQYSFRPFLRADLALMSRWLREPEVARWWVDPEKQLGLVTEDLDEPLMRQWIVEHDGQPFAYVQAYSAHAWPQPHLARLPAGTEMLDTFIGEPSMLGRDHGSTFLAEFADMLLSQGASLVGLDPAFDNARARRAFARAGFREQRIVDTADGPVALMVFGRSENAITAWQGLSL
jgi:aminoglycoside 6'-N-acetyltransferase